MLTAADLSINAIYNVLYFANSYIPETNIRMYIQYIWLLKLRGIRDTEMCGAQGERSKEHAVQRMRDKVC